MERMFCNNAAFVSGRKRTGHDRACNPHRRLGVSVALLIAGVAYINDQVLGLESVVAGHQLPITVIGPLILGMVLINPLLFRLRPSWALRPREVAVAVVLMLAGCSMAIRGMMEHFTSALALPAYWQSVSPGWRKYDLLSYAPPAMLPGGAAYSEEVLGGYLVGLGRPGDPIGLDAVPWRQWAPPLVTWLPLVILMAIALTCLALIVHRQWSSNERLRYPIAEFATTLIDRQPGRPTASIFKSKVFWMGLGIVLSIRLVNGSYYWLDQRTIQIPTAFNFEQVFIEKWPLISTIDWARNLVRPRIYPVVIGFSYFLASEASLSLGLSQFLYVPLGALLISRGLDISSNYMAGGVTGWQRFGAYLAFALVLAYTGRRYYWQVLRRTVTFRPSREVEAPVAWAGRVLLVSLAGMILITVRLGLDWPLAILTFLLMMLMFVVVSRICAETGLFFIQPRWQPLGVFLGLFGVHALGPQAIIIIGLLCVILCLDPSQSLMTYLVNGLKMCENLRIKPSKVCRPIVATFVACVLLAVAVVLWANYNFGFRRSRWSFERVPTMAFRPAAQAATSLSLQGQLEESNSLGPLQRLAAIRPERKFLYSAGAGFALVLLCGALRLRLSWWPLHPVIFMVWATAPMAAFNWSFLLGWMLKTAITRLGGHKTYQSAKPLMVGIIAGDVIGALVFMAVGAIYYLATGIIAESHPFFPK